MALTPETVGELACLREDGGVLAVGGGIHLVTSASAADRVLRDDTSFAAIQHVRRLDDDPEDRTLLESEPERHAARRRILAVPFTGERLAATAPLVDAIVAELIDRFAPRGKAELVHELARPANGLLLAQLLGIADGDRERVFALAYAVLEAENSSPPVIGNEAAAGPRAAFAEWALAHVAARRADADPPPDALTAFLRPDAATGVTLTDRELVAHLRTYCESAIGFTGRAIASLLHEVLTNDVARDAMVRGGPDAASVIEESLRIDPPVTYAMRTCVAATTVGGVEVARGDRVLVSVAGANRDPDAFADPDQFELRGARTPHVSFGRGPHVCLGAALYRLLAAATVGALLARVPDVALAPGFTYEDHPWFTGHAPQRLDVTFTPSPPPSPPSP
jgi:cytochrome P450